MIASPLRGLTARFAAGSLFRNGLFALGQSLTVAVCLLLAYRLVIAHAGLERFGVWSLMIAGSAFARVGDISGVGALARFVAAALRHDDPLRSRNIVHTVMLTSFALNVVLALAVWLAAKRALPLFVAPTYLGDAHTLMPYVITSMVIGPLAIAVTSGIDGAQRADQRALVAIAASLVFLGACALLVPRHGILGFGAAQVLQQAAALVLGWLVLRRHVAGLGWLPRRWRREIFAETTSYTVKLNAISVAALMFDPLAKFVFNHAGGPSLVALYELASRLVVQIRALVVSAATPLVPAFAARAGAGDLTFRHMLEKAMRIAALAAIGTAVITLVGAPVMSVVVLGRLSPELLTMNAALTAGWATSVLILPLYFAAQGLGMLRWNFASHVASAMSVLVGAFLVVPTFGPAGLVAAIIVGLILNTVIILLGNAYAFGVIDVVRRLWRELLGASTVIALLCGASWTIVVLAGI